MVCWYYLVIIASFLKDVRGTVWDGITPWYTGSKCNCNGYSNRCYFDQNLYEQTGHGGHCLDCTANRDGPNCERCRENYYMRDDGYCIACDCDQVGSRSLQCNAEGRCQCKLGVTGEKCDRCAANYYDFSADGCKTCGCSELGSIDNQPRCDPYSGSCYCKENVEGKRCRECKPGYFNLESQNKLGCTPCFCYGHSSECKSAPGFSKYFLESTFSKSSEKWIAEDIYKRPIDTKYDSFTQSIGVRSLGDEIIYFVAPQRFLGDQRASYNQLLEFTLRIGNDRPIPTATDIILEGGGTSVANTIFSQQNRIPSIQNQKYSFRLHEHPEYGWQPRLSSRAFISILTNLTAIKIKGIYGPEGVGYLDDFNLETASRGIAGEPALWIESCDCPSGYVGQFCESCAPGFRHSPSLGGSFMPCIPCDCNNHASICDSETGRCICQHNTTGDNCELCAKGLFGNALGGTPEDCQPCNCPGGGACLQLDEEIVVCTECPSGYAGHRCDSCSDGHFGDPAGVHGPPRPCRPCDCNGNVDLNAVGNCDATTGECLKCVRNTDGRQCEVCLPGYYGNALALPKGDCKRCQCYPPGTQENTQGATICDQSTGICRCKSHVIGRNCERCEDGYYNLHSGEGCQTCNCDPVGSLNQTCDVYSGQCHCRPGVTGLRCDHCESRKYGFSSEGCTNCECDLVGSKDLQCDASGQCPCLDNVEGRKCNLCKENKYNRQQGCIDCPDCYNLIQNAAKSHNNKLNELAKILDEIERQPTVIPDEDFPEELQKVESEINNFYLKVKNATGDDSLTEQIIGIRERGRDVSRTLSEIEENIFITMDKSEMASRNMDHADQLLDETTDKLTDIANNMEYQAVVALEEAWERAEIVGQQSDKMTAIAQEARDLAESLNNKADSIISTAKDAKNKSVVAYAKVKSTIAQQSTIEDELRYIKNDLLNTEVKLNKTREWTKEVSENAGIVNKNALALLSEVKNLVVPEIDIPELRRKSKELKEEAYRLSNKSNGLFTESSGLRKDIDKQNIIGKELLLTAYLQQEDANNLRNELVFRDSQAKGAINLWNEILEGAESNFKLLTEFDTQTQKSKDEAEAALKTIDEIEIIINEAQEATDNAQGNLEEAKKNANLALDKAEQADELAKNASNKAEQIKTEAEILYKNTSALGEEAGLMFDRVLNTEGELKNLLEQTISNDSLVNEAKEKVGRAGKDTDEVSKKVYDLLTDVEDIMSELENSPNIDDKDIERLEEEIRLTEQRIKEARLEEKLENLQKEHKMQNDLIDQYKSQIAILQREVDNIEQIVETLPDDCFKKLELEP